MLSAGLLLAATTCGNSLIQQQGDEWVIKNDYTKITVNSKTGSITGGGDHTGSGDYGMNVLAGMGVESVRSGKVYRLDGCNGVTVNQHADTHLTISNIVDSCTDPRINETITIKLNDQFAHFSIEGAVIKSDDSITRRVITQKASSMYSLFDLGVVQMLNGESIGNTYYPSKDGLPRIYSLGGFGPEEHQAGNRSVALLRGYNTSAVTLVSKSDMSELHEVLTGAYNRVDNWNEQNDITPVTTTGFQYTHPLVVTLNNRDFPILRQNNGMKRSNFDNNDDYTAFMTGIYASPVGNLCTHSNEVESGFRVGQIATTIHRPTTGYSNNYNFFDPDNYLSTSALLYSGDRYLQNQVLQVLERNGDFINDKGQLPHHFQGVYPQYNALSGETQTGPNVFWILSCFNYVKLTGDNDWLEGYMPKLRKASAFLFDMIVDGPQKPLLSVPGSLMIDVFIRNKMTSDTNAMAVGFFREFAAAELLTGNATGAAVLSELADSISEQMMKYLWDKKSDDHFITQLNPDGSTRDFVDYDSNFIAVSNGIVSKPELVQKLFNRIDSGRCAPAHTFVSEKYYGPSDCTSGNTGDSWTAMGRIAWFDSLSRKLYNDSKHFDDVIMNPLISEVIKRTWLHERYNCDGTAMVNRTASYFEYPSVTSMLIHRVRYGIDLGLNNITISPFPASSFEYNAGTVSVSYNQTSVTLRVPGVGQKSATITGLIPSSTYQIKTTGCGQIPQQAAVTSSGGVLTTMIQVGNSMTNSCVVSIVKLN